MKTLIKISLKISTSIVIKFVCLSIVEKISKFFSLTKKKKCDSKVFSTKALDCGWENERMGRWTGGGIYGIKKFSSPYVLFFFLSRRHWLEMPTRVWFSKSNRKTSSLASQSTSSWFSTNEFLHSHPSSPRTGTVLVRFRDNYDCGTSRTKDSSKIYCTRSFGVDVYLYI